MTNAEDLKQFDEWWNKNEAQFTADSCHMSQYHMASVVWAAAVKSQEATIESLEDETRVLQANMPLDD